MIGAVEILLAEMDVVGADVERDPPVVVEDQLRAGARADRQRRARLACDLGVGRDP